MTVLEPNQPWPQVEVTEFNRSIGVFGGYQYKIIDKPINALVNENISHYTYKRGDMPTTLFAGPRASEKIQDCIMRDELLKNTITTKFLGGALNGRKFLGLNLVFAIDDGLWIA